MAPAKAIELWPEGNDFWSVLSGRHALTLCFRAYAGATVISHEAAVVSVRSRQLSLLSAPKAFKPNTEAYGTYCNTSSNPSECFCCAKDKYGNTINNNESLNLILTVTFLL